MELDLTFKHTANVSRVFFVSSINPRALAHRTRVLPDLRTAPVVRIQMTRSKQRDLSEYPI